MSINSVNKADKLPGDHSGGGDPIASGQDHGGGGSAGGSVSSHSRAPSISAATAVGMGCGVHRECLHVQGLRLPGWGVKHNSGAEAGAKVGAEDALGQMEKQQQGRLDQLLLGVMNLSYLPVLDLMITVDLELGQITIM